MLTPRTCQQVKEDGKMLTPRTCQQVKEDGSRCLAPPLQDGDFCFWHDPEHQAEAAEARRLGGLRRRREGAIVGAFEVGELEDVVSLRRLLQIAVIDTLSLESSISRSRTLGYLTQVGAMLLEKAELEERLEALEATLDTRLLPERTKRW
jgi:hypothetical protein